MLVEDSIGQNAAVEVKSPFSMEVAFSRFTWTCSRLRQRLHHPDHPGLEREGL
jgi:hypothetical protein